MLISSTVLLEHRLLIPLDFLSCSQARYSRSRSSIGVKLNKVD